MLCFFAIIVEDKPPELAMYFISAPHFLRFGRIVELVKLPDPIIPKTPFLPLYDLFTNLMVLSSLEEEEYSKIDAIDFELDISPYIF